jgi:hypothetical protein
MSLLINLSTPLSFHFLIFHFKNQLPNLIKILDAMRAAHGDDYYICRFQVLSISLLLNLSNPLTLIRQI